MSNEIEGVDIHGHGVPVQFLEEVRRSKLGGVKVEVTDGRYVVTFPGAKALRPCAGVMLQFEERLGWLDSQGMRHQMMSPWLDVHGQELPPADGQVWVRQMNDFMAEAVEQSGGRLHAYASLHLSDPKAAAVELERIAGKLNMTGCMLPTFFPSGRLSESRYDVMWEAAQALNIPIVLHPTTDSPSACLFEQQPKFKGVMGRPLDTTLAAAELMATGVLDRFPKLNLVLVHGGGFLPFQSGRMDREFAGESGTLASEHMKRFHYDTVLMSPPALRMLFELVGVSQVVIGSDYGAAPKERGAPKLTDSLDRTGIDEASRRKVVRENAETLFRIPSA